MSDPAERVTIALEIAEMERKAGRASEALSELELAARLAPNDVRLGAPLADLLFAAGRLDEAAPIYEKLAEEAKAARRMRDVARYRQRQGGILEARGDTAAALAAYEEAFRVNPTDVATMAGLGRLYFAAKEWEKARRSTSRWCSRRLDADSGIAKADVYWSLGVIHLELGQEPKAKGMFQRGLELDPRHEKLRARAPPSSAAEAERAAGLDGGVAAAVLVIGSAMGRPATGPPAPGCHSGPGRGAPTGRSSAHRSG